MVGDNRIEKEEAKKEKSKNIAALKFSSNNIYMNIFRNAKTACTTYFLFLKISWSYPFFTSPKTPSRTPLYTSEVIWEKSKIK